MGFFWLVPRLGCDSCRYFSRIMLEKTQAEAGNVEEFLGGRSADFTK